MTAIARAGMVHKGMGGVRIRIELVLLIKFRKLKIELAHILLGGVRIIGAEVTLDRATNFRSPLKWRGNIAAPGVKSVASVENDGRFKLGTGSGHEIGDSAAHAKTDYAQAILINGRLRSQQSRRRIDIIDNLPITESGTARNDIVAAFRAIAMIEIRRSGDVAGFRQSSRYTLHEFVDGPLVLDNYDPWKGTGSFGDAQVHAHHAVVGCSLLPARLCHSFPLNLAGVYRRRPIVSSLEPPLKLIENRNNFVETFNLPIVSRSSRRAAIDQNSQQAGIGSAVQIVFFAIADVHGLGGRQVMPS